MMQDKGKSISLYTKRLIQLVDEFRERIVAGTREPENFLTITEIEYLWSELKGNTSVLYSDMLEEILEQIDESELISKKKQNT